MIKPANLSGTTTVLAAAERFWKHFAKQTVISGQDLPQSGMAGFSGGQHGMSSAISVICSPDIIPAAAGLANGAVTMPTIARTESSMRRVRQSFTQKFSHTEPYVGRPTRFTRLPDAERPGS
jgi:hypothetical protein